MIHRRLLVVGVVLAGLTLAACRRETPPPPAPPPAQEDPGPDLDSLRAYQDSVRAAQEAEARALAEREAAIANARAILEEIVYFDYDESAIRPDTERTLLRKIEVLQSSPAVRLRLEGHTDERGSVEYNLALGNRRAESVRQFLQQFGISGDRLETTSYGEERPRVNRSDEAAWAQNRRVEFVITSGGGQINPPSN